MSVPFKELAGSPQESYGPDGMKAQRRLLCAWEDRQALVRKLLGDGYDFGARRAGLPAGRAVVAMRVAVAPFESRPDHQPRFDDVTRHVNGYSGQYAELTVEYELLDANRSRRDLPEPEPHTFLTYRMDSWGQYLALAQQSHVWQSHPDVAWPAAAFPSIRIPHPQHRVQWHRVLDPPWEAIRQCVGCVNAAEFLGAPAETLLLEGIAADHEFIALDAFQEPAYAWRLQYVFREKAVKYGGGVYGWNHAFRPLPATTPGYERLCDGNGAGLYATADFARLFRYRLDNRVGGG